MKESQSRTLELLQVYRGLAALMVVFYHATLIIFVTYGVTVLQGFFSFGFAGVHLFFVLSGFIIAYAHGGDIGKPKEVSRYAYKRFSRIYPIYWIVLAIYLPFWVGSLYGPINWYHLFDNVTLLRISGHDKIVAVAWTLSHEILFYGVFAILILSRRLGIVFMFLWASLLVYSLISGMPVRPPWSIAQWTQIDYGVFVNFTKLMSQPINLLFFLGMLSYLFYSKFKNSFRSERIASASLWVGLAIFVGTSIYWVQVTTTHVGWGATNLYYGIAFFFLVLGVISQRKDAWAARQKFLVLAGNASYSIYLMHYGLQGLIVKLLGDEPPVQIELLFLVLIIVPTAFGIAVHVWIERPMMERLRGARSIGRPRT